MKIIRLVTLLLLCMTVHFAWAQQAKASGDSHTISMTVTDEETKETVIMASCSLDPLGSITVTDVDGKATFQKVPSGQYTLKVSYVGYETYTSLLRPTTSERNLTKRLTLG